MALTTSKRFVNRQPVQCVTFLGALLLVGTMSSSLEDICNTGSDSRALNISGPVTETSQGTLQYTITERQSSGSFRTCINSKGHTVREATDDDFIKTPAACESEVPVFVVVHAATAKNGVGVADNVREIVCDLLFSCEKSGVYNLATNITLNVVGPGVDIIRKLLTEELGGRFGKIDIKNMDGDPNTWEFSTINLMISYAKELTAGGVDAHMLYIHTKGLYTKGLHKDPVAKWHWRKYLEHWTLDRQQEARKLLSLGYDTVGSNAIDFSSGQENDKRFRINPSHGWHYSGNFWWTTAHHLARQRHLDANDINVLDPVERLRAEFTILSGLPHMCAGEMHHSANAHMYDLNAVPSQWELVNQPTGTKLLP